MKQIIAFFITLNFIFARINPFEPVVTPINNQKIKPSFFKQAKIYLPKDARILKKVIFVYQSVSSDIKQKEVTINKDIDFHSPIILTHNPKKFKTAFINLKVIKLAIKYKTIFINTKDKLIRAFFLVKPFRLVLDFKRDNNFYTIKKNLNSFVKKVVIGSHGSFYRVVIYLDTNYNYKIAKLNKGIKIDLY